MLDGSEVQLLVRRRRGWGSGPGPSSRTALPGTSIEKKDKPLPRLNIHSAFWILSSLAITYYVEFFKTVKEIIQKESGWFVLGSCLLAVSLSVAFYCIIYLEWYHGIADYETSYPTLVPITTASFIAAAVWCFRTIYLPSPCVVETFGLHEASDLLRNELGPPNLNKGIKIGIENSVSVASLLMAPQKLPGSVSRMRLFRSSLVPHLTHLGHFPGAIWKSYRSIRHPWIFMAIHPFNISLWPVWSFLTPPVLFIQFMGIIMLVSLLG